MKGIFKLKRVESTSTIAVGLLTIQYLFFIKTDSGNSLFFYLGLLVLLSGLFVPFVADLIAYGWEKLTELLGWINSRIILVLVYFLVLTPFSMVYRVFNKDNLGLKRKKNSYYHKRSYSYKKKDLENIW